MYSINVIKSLSIKLLTCLILSSFASQLLAEEKVVDQVWHQRYDNSEWVSLARIESVHSLVNPALSHESGMISVQGYSYTLSVMQDWKIGSSEGEKLRIDLSDCPILLTLDGEYLVFADRNYRGQLQVNSCDHFVHISQAAPLLSLLNEKQGARAANVKP